MPKQKDAILARKAAERNSQRRIRRVLAGIGLSFAGMVTAFAIAPHTQISQYPTQEVVHQVSLPAGDALLVPDDFWRETRVQSGDTVAALLARMQVDDPAALAFINQDAALRRLIKLRTGARVQAHAEGDGTLLSLRYPTADHRWLTIERTGESFGFRTEPMPQETRLVMRSSRIKSSLFAAMDYARIPDEIAVQLTDVFSSEIDFHRDLHRGDQFSIVYESTFANGEPIKHGRILAAEFINNGVAHRAIWYATGNGTGSYYTPEGRSLKKAFLRSPLEVSRISSGFSEARFHPVLKTWRAHKGVDYAAPTGTKIRATADGVVEKIGREHGYGNLIVLRHHGAYSTAYGHLSGFAPGLRPGSRISQGQTIGYVGATGLASGPHLHYEFRIHNIQHNPLALKLPTSIPLSAQQKVQFAQVSAPLISRLDKLRNTNLARLE